MKGGIFGTRFRRSSYRTGPARCGYYGELLEERRLLTGVNDALTNDLAENTLQIARFEVGSDSDSQVVESHRLEKVRHIIDSSNERSLVTTSADGQANNSATATGISVSSATFGNIEVGGDTDWFQFTAVAGVDYVFETALTSLHDSKLALYASDGTTQLESDDDGGRGTASRINWTAPASGTYYLEVRAFSTSQFGSYTFTGTIRQDEEG